MTGDDDWSAAEALERAELMSAKAAATGVYSRRAAVITAVWAGTVAGLMVAEIGWWFVLAIAGLIVYTVWQRGRAASLREIGNWRDLGITVVCVLALYGFVLLGFAGAARGVFAAPVLAGIGVAAMLYGAMHVAHHRRWASAH